MLERLYEDDFVQVSSLLELKNDVERAQKQLLVQPRGEDTCSTAGRTGDQILTPKIIIIIRKLSSYDDLFLYLIPVSITRALRSRLVSDVTD